MNVTTQDLERLEWNKFEDLIFDLLQEEGFKNVKKNGKGADGGIDITAQTSLDFPLGLRTDMRFLVQCKRYRKYPNPSKIRENIQQIAKNYNKSDSILSYLLVTPNNPPTNFVSMMNDLGSIQFGLMIERFSVHVLYGSNLVYHINKNQFLSTKYFEQ